MLISETDWPIHVTLGGERNKKYFYEEIKKKKKGLIESAGLNKK